MEREKKTNELLEIFLSYAEICARDREVQGPDLNPVYVLPLHLVEWVSKV